MKITWDAIAEGRTESLSGKWVEIDGWVIQPETAGRPIHFALTAEPPCCADCLPRNPLARVEVFMAEPVSASQPVRLAGYWTRLEGDEAGWRYQLHDARLLPHPAALVHAGFTRRAVLAGSVALGLSAWMPQAKAAPDEAAIAAAREALAGNITIDLHSHAGSIGGLRRIEEQAPYTPVADPMRAGRMAVICLSMVGDTPATKATEDNKRIRPFRDPAPGELHAYAQKAFARLHGLVAEQKLGVIADAASLKNATAARPAVLVAAEGGDFLEGLSDRVDEYFEKWKLRHLQLTHYRVNELGDIQTEAPVHGGLTDAGAAVIKRCNERGIVVDVAHGTYDLVKRAASVTTKPLVLSHTSLITQGRSYTRMILPNHAKLIAGTGGVVGIWPPTTIFPDMETYAAGIAQMVDAIGIDHVGLGSDMQGLLSPSIFPSYRQLPALAAALMARGFKQDEMLKLLGGNYLRVALATLQ